MQRIVYRYQRDVSASMLHHNALRDLFLLATQQSGLPVDEGARGIVLGPPLPPGATSDAEQAVLVLTLPHDPSQVCQWLNVHLPAGIRVERCWIALPRSADGNPANLDEAVYTVRWQDAPGTADIAARIQQFLASTEVSYTRIREKKVQHLNARAFVYACEIEACHDGALRLRMTLSIGPKGSLRPEELLQVLGYEPAPGALSIHRAALQRSAWRHPSPSSTIHQWWRGTA